MKNILKFVLLLSCFILTSSAFALSVDGSVSAKWLEKNLNKPGLKIIEMSDASSFTFKGHIPRAVYTNKSDWRYQAQDGSLVHLSVKSLEIKMQDLGVNDNDAVVIYYKGDNLNEILGAHYLFWLFHYLGHTNVSILDMGWHGWLKAKAPILHDEPKIKKGNFKARPIKALEISTNELYAIHNAYNVVDARPHNYFLGLGKFPSNTRYGRIANSISQQWSDFLITDKNGLIYIDTSKKVPLLKAKVLTKNQPILLTCFGGTGASIDYFMFYINGYKNLRVHDEGLRRWNSQNYPLNFSESMYDMMEK
jgi:thiosulfate/3-mercaptopyruvate sulfurtransferase